MNDQQLVEALHHLGIDEGNVRCLALLPLAQIAWAHGRIDPGVRDRVVHLATDSFALDPSGVRVVDGWLTHEPSTRYLAQGRRLLLELAHRSDEIASDVSVDTLWEVIDFSTKIARTASGVMGKLVRRDKDPATEAAKAIAEELSVPPTASLRDVFGVEAGGDFGGFDDHDEDEVTSIRPLADFQVNDEGGERGVEILCTGAATATDPQLGYLVCEYLGEPLRIALDGRSVSVGRTTGQDIQIRWDGLVSRRHCRFYKDDHGRFFLQDLKSMNGTQVNGEQIATRQLFGTERILIGNQMFEYAPTALPIDDYDTASVDDVLRRLGDLERPQLKTMLVLEGVGLRRFAVLDCIRNLLDEEPTVEVPLLLDPHDPDDGGVPLGGIRLGGEAPEADDDPKDVIQEVVFDSSEPAVDEDDSFHISVRRRIKKAPPLVDDTKHMMVGGDTPVTSDAIPEMLFYAGPEEEEIIGAGDAEEEVEAVTPFTDASPERLITQFVGELNLASDPLKTPGARQILKADRQTKAATTVIAARRLCGVVDGAGMVRTPITPAEKDALKALVTRCLRAHLPFDDAGLVAMASLVPSMDQVAAFPLAGLLTAIERQVAENPPSEDLTHALGEMRLWLQDFDAKKASALDQRVKGLLSLNHEARVSMDSGWGRAADRWFHGLTPTQRAAWQPLLQLAQEQGPHARPSARWLGEVQTAIEGIGAEGYYSGIVALLDACQPGPQLLPANELLLVGLVHTTVAQADRTVALSVAQLTRRAFEKLASHGARSQRIGNACIVALAWMPYGRAKHHLDQIAREVPYKGVKRRIAALR